MISPWANDNRYASQQAQIAAPPVVSPEDMAAIEFLTGGSGRNLQSGSPVSIISSDPVSDNMADQTQELVDAKLAAVEARGETRFAELSAKIDRLADAVERSSAVSSKAIADIHTEIVTMKSDNKFTRWTIVGAVIAGLAALWVTQSNMLASFQLGISIHEAQKPTDTPKGQ